MTRHLFALSLLGLSFALNPSFAAAQETLRPLAEALLDVQADAGALEARIETERFAALKSLPENTPIRMTGLNAKWRLPFVIARDELATKASVTFKWTPSPVLLPVKSQLNLRLNGELERSLPITTEEIGRTVVTTVELNPKRLKDLNELEFEFVGSYEHNCESPADASLWLEIDRESTLTLSKQKIRVANELQLLPSPFLDPGARSRLTLPVLFPVRPSDKTLQAAAVLASWAGKTADWRDLSLPVHYGEAPAEGHFVVFATPETLPEFLRGTAEITGPEVRIADAPHSDWAKVLVIAGRNDEELVEAAQALALEGDRFAGPRVLVTEPPRLPPRPAYDARKWLPTDRKVRFDELVDHPSQLRSRGTFPDPIAVHFRLAPDLFVLPRTSIPMELSYRYTPPGEDAKASVRVRINDALMGYEVLESDESATAPVVRRVAALDAMAGFLRALSLPTVHLDAANTLEFDFQYDVAVTDSSLPGKCPSVSLTENQVEIDPASTLDFRGFYHYAELPNLRLFTLSGYPYSRFADLAQTTVVLPKNPEAQDVSTMLAAVGRIGSQTGTAGVLVTVSTDPSPEALIDRDVLVIGNLGSGGDVPAGTPFAEEIRRGLAPENAPALRKDRAIRVRTDSPESSRQAALVSFESPVTKGRTVTALLSQPGAGTALLQDKLGAAGSFYDVDGAVSFLTPKGSVNFPPAEVYAMGDLPWHQRIWNQLLDKPFVLFGITLVFLACAALLLYLLMTRVVAGRLLSAREKLRVPSNRKS